MDNKAFIFDGRPPTFPKDIESISHQWIEYDIQYRLGAVSIEEYSAIVDALLRTIASELGLPNCEGLVFTSSYQESINSIIKGIAWVAGVKSKVMTIEGDPLTYASSVNWLLRLGIEHQEIKLLHNGEVDFKKALLANEEKAVLFAFDSVAPEVYQVRPIQEIAKYYRSIGTLIAVDYTKLFFMGQPIDFETVDAFIIDLEAIGGLSGSSLFWINPKVNWAPLISGGLEQSGFRGGSLSTMLLGAGLLAIRESKSLASKRSLHFHQLSVKASELALKYIPDSKRVSTPNALDIGFTLLLPKVIGESIVVAAREQGLYFRTSSACQSTIGKASRILQAMGYSEEDAASAVHFSFRDEHTEADLEAAISILRTVYDRVKSISF